jgi:hypothetical protein
MNAVSVGKNTGAILNTTTGGCELSAARWENSFAFTLVRTAARATVNGNEFALFHLELFVMYHFPFMKAARAQRFTFVFFTGGGFFERQNIGHGC